VSAHSPDASGATQAYIGLMSGTSMDGVDGVLGLIGPDGQWQGSLAHAHAPFDAPLRAELMALNTSGIDEIHRAALAGQALARAYARVTQQLLLVLPKGTSVRALGAHGQTVRHRPELGYTTQLLAPALLAELIGVDVVADLRSRDVAAGGQGAPLVPIFHQAVMASPDHSVAVLNVGGMANVSVLRPGLSPLGFDCGPGNVLMDLWCQGHLGQPFDADGAWAASGMPQASWLKLALDEPYFSLPAPKSTGRDLFHAGWLQAWLQACGLDKAAANLRAADVQATLCELTAQSCAQAIGPEASEVLVCGGGALNGHFMRRLQAALQAQRVGVSMGANEGVKVHTTEARGLPPMEVEAAAFAWLAWACVNRQSGNVPAVTGAAGPRVLGAIYPG
jgi:anhydro-N-acetylmuramic acid kinase